MSERPARTNTRKRYPAYKPSGVEWLGDVPEGWKVRRLKTLLAKNDGGIWGEDFDEDGTIVLRSTEQTVDGKWRIIEPAKRRLSASEYVTFLLRAGDLVMTKSSGSAQHIGKTSIVTEEIEEMNCCFSNFMQRLRVTVETKPQFVWYVLNGEIGREQFCYYSSTTTGLANLNGSVIGNISIAVPPNFEQRSIAAFLDRETARFDTLIEKKQRQIELLQEKRSALISQVVTKGLDPHVRTKDSGIEWLGEVPEHWGVKRIKHIGTIRYGLGEPPEYVHDGIPFIRATDIKRGKIDLYCVKKVDDKDIPWSRRPTLALDEILVVRSGAYTGDSAIVTEHTAGCIAGYDMVLTVTKAYAPFVAWVLLSKYMLHSQIYLERLRAAQPHLNAEELGGFVILIPPLWEQRLIADSLFHEAENIDAMMHKIEKSVDTLREYRTALISAAVTGKIDVREKGES